MEWVRKQLLKVPMLRDWIVSVEDSRAHQNLREHFVPLIEEARRAKNDLDAQNLYAEWIHNQTQIDEPTYVAASDRLVRKARRHYVPVPSTPRKYDDVSDDWQFSQTTGDWALAVPTYQRLQREVQTAQRAANDEWRKWVTLGLALAGFFFGTASLWMKTKQPDPCPRNYYRNDAGACVFAPQAPVPIQSLGPKDIAKD